jgi:hypothetical protein
MTKTTITTTKTKHMNILNTTKKKRSLSKKRDHFYILRKRRQITKLFKNTQLRVAFHTQDTINNILKHHAQTDKYNISGIYQMKCLDCPLKYVGQTGRTFNVRHKAHTHAIRSNRGNSGYLNHILNKGHTYGTMTDTMEVIRTGRKGRRLNTLEKYHI